MSDSLCEKGVLYAKIKVKNSFLHLITTHFQASYFGSSDNNWKLSIDTRLDQIRDLTKYIGTLIREKNIKLDDIFILCGDFNVDFHNFVKMKKVCMF
jgi:endonuclease/exonuclease/phosphatase family metal-dependent hydrolase